MVTKGEYIKLDDLAIFGFNEPPFSSSADPRFLYYTEPHAETITRIQTGLEFREGCAVITGEIGTGKTSLAKRTYELLTQDSRPYEPRFIHSAGWPHKLAAMKDICAAFGLQKRRAYEDGQRELEKYSIALYQNEVIPVLLVDDAHNIDPSAFEAIQTLLNFDVGQKLFQIILFGQLEIYGKIDLAPSLKSRVSYWKMIGAISRDEMIEMINFRTSVAGRKRALFTESAYNMIFEYSNIPRSIVIICHEALLRLIATTKDDPESAMIDETIIQWAIDQHKERVAPKV